MKWLRLIFGNTAEEAVDKSVDPAESDRYERELTYPATSIESETTSRSRQTIQPIPKDWTEHPAFIGAREVIALRDLIEKAIAGAPNSTRDEGKALDLTLGRLPAWPQYEQFRIELSDEDAPIWWSPGFEFPEHQDGIALFQIAALRDRAAALNVKGRSKAEIASRLRAVLDDSAATTLANKGRADWQARVDRRERRKFCEVLGHTVGAAINGINGARWYEENIGHMICKKRWTSGPCCKRYDRADQSVRIVGLPFPHVNVLTIPAHPGCSCVCVDASYTQSSAAPASGESINQVLHALVLGGTPRPIERCACGGPCRLVRSFANDVNSVNDPAKRDTRKASRAG